MGWFIRECVGGALCMTASSYHLLTTEGSILGKKRKKKEEGENEKRVKISETGTRSWVTDPPSSFCCSLTGFIMAAVKEARWLAGRIWMSLLLVRVDSGICVCVCVCVHLCELIAIHWVVDCVLLSTLALFVRTLHTLGTHTHTCTHKHTHTHIWIWTRHSSSGRAFAKSERKREREGKKERGRKYELTNSTIHSHGSAVLAGPGLRHEWVWS